MIDKEEIRIPCPACDGSGVVEGWAPDGYSVSLGVYYPERGPDEPCDKCGATGEATCRNCLSGAAGVHVMDADSGWYWCGYCWAKEWERRVEEVRRRERARCAASPVDLDDLPF